MVHKVCEFFKLFHEIVKLFPKTEKYSLGQKIENLALDILELAIKAVDSMGQTKYLLLKEIDAKNHLLKILVRLAKEIKIIDDKKYLALQEILQEIGRMVGGWIKTVQEKQQRL